LPTCRMNLVLWSVRFVLLRRTFEFFVRLVV
jgi:hypothetical protein